MGKDKENKKSLWDMFFGVLDEEDDNGTYPEEELEDEDENLASALEGKKKKKGKKIVPVFEDTKEISFNNDAEEEGGATEEVAEEEGGVTEEVTGEEGGQDKEQEEEVKEYDNERNFSAEELEPRFKAPAESYFFVHDGPTLKDLYDLEYYLGTITENQFRHHVREDGNDFANWVRGVFKEEGLASELERAGDRDSMCSILSNFLNLR
ncbi:MAG: hypothetical protein ACQEP6_00130 [Patescibacteria group bacterium]